MYKTRHLIVGKFQVARLHWALVHGSTTSKQFMEAYPTYAQSQVPEDSSLQGKYWMCCLLVSSSLTIVRNNHSAAC